MITLTGQNLWSNERAYEIIRSIDMYSYNKLIPNVFSIYVDCIYGERRMPYYQLNISEIVLYENWIFRGINAETIKKVKFYTNDKESASKLISEENLKSFLLEEKDLYKNLREEKMNEEDYDEADRANQLYFLLENFLYELDDKFKSKEIITIHEMLQMQNFQMN